MFTIRLWDYRLLKVLPDKFIIAEWRECIAIKRQWEKGTLKHRLVSYVMKYDRGYFYNYVSHVCIEMINRDINYQTKYFDEICEFCDVNVWTAGLLDLKEYPEHNNRYLKQCYYNLQEKADRGIITEEEWKLIHKHIYGIIKEDDI